MLFAYFVSRLFFFFSSRQEYCILLSAEVKKKGASTPVWKVIEKPVLKEN